MNRRFVLPVVLILLAVCAAIAAFAYFGNKSDEPLPPEILSTTPITSETQDDTQAELANNTTSQSQTTANTATHTGFAPLAQLPFFVEDEDKIPDLSKKRIEFSYGVAKDSKPHQISVDAQKFFDAKGYKAFAYDAKSSGKRLYLTFDTGYENGVTAGILDTLRDKKVPAAFFSTLHHVKTAPDLIARMITEGHIVGNHSVSHPDFTAISRKKMIEEIQGYDNYLRVNFGYTAPFFRFPEGAYSEDALHLVQTLGYTSAFWSVSWADWDVNAQRGKQAAFDTITARLHPGAVIMLHSVSTDNAGALGDIIDWARAQGYEFYGLDDGF
ncbi:MAG: polysaccharide deacetylase family protein [Oscillospiraceae bacterium]|nr:polysaccharide deacetylase family protein [Oscillospiraceae bacterium]